MASKGFAMHGNSFFYNFFFSIPFSFSTIRTISHLEKGKKKVLKPTRLVSIRALISVFGQS
ncbi:hypothetical protein LguiB_021985 [Lonicera macranthoides]